MSTFSSTVLVALLATTLVAQSDDKQPSTPPPAPKSALEALAKYNPKQGRTQVGSVAEVALGEGWVWLDGADGKRFLRDCDNQPSPATLGVAMPPDFVESGVFAVYSYADDGHVADDEAPDYDALLADMKDNAEENEHRKKAGIPTVETLGWAEPPHYDKAAHKLYWATRLRFEGSGGETLNYNVRVLGRTGHLVVNGVGDIDQLALVAAHSKSLLTATEFVAGKRYTDFDPQYDKVAAYGIGGLIAGKLALKAGLFAKLGLLLVKFLKPLLIGLAVIGGVLFKIFAGRKKDAPAQA